MPPGFHVRSILRWPRRSAALMAALTVVGESEHLFASLWIPGNADRASRFRWSEITVQTHFADEVSLASAKTCQSQASRHAAKFFQSSCGVHANELSVI